MAVRLRAEDTKPSREPGGRSGDGGQDVALGGGCVDGRVGAGAAGEGVAARATRQDVVTRAPSEAPRTWVRRRFAASARRDQVSSAA